MSSMDRRLRNDILVDELVNGIAEIVSRHRVEQNRRGEWFATNQLDDLRCLIEMHGWGVAREFQAGRIDDRDNAYDLARNRALLDILGLAAASELTTMILTYTIGKLNPILADKLKAKRGDQRNEQRHQGVRRGSADPRTVQNRRSP